MKLSKDQITIIPNHLSEDNEFNVTVINDSDKFASFQLELNAPGLEDKSDFKWYKIEPKICTKKPPGSETEFRVAITKPPIPAYNKTIDLDVKAFSVEDDKFESEKIKLKIENPLPKIELKLLYEKFDKIDAKPGQKIDIPVIITNLSSNLTNVQLQLFANLPTSEANSEVILPTRPKVLNIPLEIPNDAKLGEYEFIIRDVSDNNYSQSNKKDRPYVKGILNILPHGIIELKCDNPVQEIPCVENNTENNQIDTVIYKLEFINKFHLEEAVDIDVHIREKNVKTIDYNTSGSFTLSSQQQKEELIINARLTEKRPLFGWKRQFTIVAKPYCKSNNQVKFQPKTQRLVLNVSPTIPFWLQLLGLISIPLLIISLFNYFTFPRHDAPVTSIGISDLGGTVISGSSDRTIRRWQVDDSWFGNNRGLKFEDILAKDSDIPKAVRVIRFLPKIIV
ncbi:MAG: hypothetical protein HC907_27575 [Richelia sp. SM1_7_0]|nr:hypothetical protein [Richelia sp. SM1_7_0]